MPILDIVETPFRAVIQQCAACGGVASLPTAKLQLGQVVGAEADPNTIALPPCSKCGAVEALIRTFDSAPEELSAHRRKVNALAEHLKASGQVHSDLVDTIAADKRVSPQVGSLLGPVQAISGMPALPAGVNVRKVPVASSIADLAQALLPKVEASNRKAAGKLDPARAALREARRAAKSAAPVPAPVSAALAAEAPAAPPAPAPAADPAPASAGKGKGKGKGNA